jgi:hypothetical protein
MYKQRDEQSHRLYRQADWLTTDSCKAGLANSTGKLDKNSKLVQNEGS